MTRWLFFHFIWFTCLFLIYFLNFQNGGKLLRSADACSKGKDGAAPAATVCEASLWSEGLRARRLCDQISLCLKSRSWKVGEWGWAWGTCLCFRIRCGRQCCKPVPAESLHQWPHLDLVLAPCVSMCVCVFVWSIFLSALWNQAIIPSRISHLSLSTIFPFLMTLPQLQLYILLHHYLNVLHWSGHSLRWLLQWWEVFLQWRV